MYQFAQLVLWLWLPVVVVLFLVMEPRRAVVVSIITAWLFLPQLHYAMPMVPNYSKMTATSYGIIIGAILLDPQSRILRFKPLWIDIPIVIWCLSPFMSSVTNGLGAYDGASAVVYAIVKDGMPYLIGRLYFRTPGEAKELAMGIVIGGLIYVPLCLFEVRMSPQLHHMIYSFHPFDDWAQAKRWGGFRPTVFMKHGLAVGVWMCSCAAIGFWMWRAKAVKDVFGIPMWVVAPLLIVTAILAKSTGALVLLALVVSGMLILRYFNTKVVLYALVVGTPIFLFARSTGLLHAEGVGQNIGQIMPILGNRGSSLDFRLAHENAIVGHTFARPLFGWGGWGRGYEVMVKDSDIKAIPDSLWIVAFGRGGFVGLTSLYAMYLLPFFVLLLKLKPKEWTSTYLAPLTGLAMLTLIYALDGLFNAMETPVSVVALGAVGGMAASLSRGASVVSRKASLLGSMQQGQAQTTLPDDFDESMPLVMLDSPPNRGPQEGDS